MPLTPERRCGRFAGLGIQLLARWHPAVRDAFRRRRVGDSMASGPGRGRYVKNRQMITICPAVGGFRRYQHVPNEIEFITCGG
jgi:hypothetical protein